jgi:hypothetical protein
MGRGLGWLSSDGEKLRLDENFELVEAEPNYFKIILL